MAGIGLQPSEQAETLPQLVADFLADAALWVPPKTLEWYRQFLKDFAGRHPKLPPAKISESHLRRWLHEPRKRPWGQSTHPFQGG